MSPSENQPSKPDKSTARPADSAPETEPQAPPGDLAVWDYLKQFIIMLNSQVWINLGLVVNPATNEQRVDLEQARAGINVISYMLDQLDPELSTAERKEFKTLEANLKLNFVQCQAGSEASTKPEAKSDSTDEADEAAPE